MHIACYCGHVLADITDSLPYKAHLLSDRAMIESYQRVGALLEEFISLLSREARSAWTRDRLGESYPADWTAREVICDVVGRVMLWQFRTVYECSNCGRILVETAPGSHKYSALLADPKFGGPVLPEPRDGGPGTPRTDV